MANFPIDENQETLELELRKIETSDPVHADIYNALFQKLINNDAFLERLADKMIRQAMISHVLDSNNAGMVLGADVGPKITTITDGLQRALDVLNTKIIYVDTPSVPITASAGQSWFADIPFTKQDGYIPISATINCTGGNSQAYIIGIHQLTNGSVRVAFQNYSGSPQTINISAKVVLIKQT